MFKPSKWCCFNSLVLTWPSVEFFFLWKKISGDCLILQNIRCSSEVPLDIISFRTLLLKKKKKLLSILMLYFMVWKMLVSPGRSPRGSSLDRMSFRVDDQIAHSEPGEIAADEVMTRCEFSINDWIRVLYTLSSLCSVKIWTKQYILKWLCSCVGGHAIFLVFNQKQTWKITKEFLKIGKMFHDHVFLLTLHILHLRFISQMHVHLCNLFSEVQSFS